MQRTEVDGTDVEMSRLGFGTGSLHRVPRRSDRLRLLETALEVGITHFDTAPSYGFGLAEIDLGHFLRRRRERVTVASKVGLYPPGGPPSTAVVWGRMAAGRLFPALSRARVDWAVKTAAESLDLTLRRCGTDHLDLLLLHEPDAALIAADEVLGWLEARRAAGSIRWWGLAGEPERVRAWAVDRHGLAPIVQTRDSLAGREAQFLLDSGRPLQITYGYLSARAAADRRPSIYRDALARNPTGAVLFSSTSADHIATVAEAGS